MLESRDLVIQLETRVGSVETRLEKLERDVRDDLKGLKAAVDTLSIQLVGVTATMASQSAVRTWAWRALSFVAALSGWAMALIALMHPATH